HSFRPERIYRHHRKPDFSMSNPDHWASLASTLGAEPTAPASRSEEKPVPRAPTPAPRTATPKSEPRPDTDWSQLANDLGLSPSEAPPRSAPPPKAPSRASSPPPAAPPKRREAPEPPRQRESAWGAEEFLAEEADDEPAEARYIEAELVD